MTYFIIKTSKALRRKNKSTQRFRQLEHLVKELNSSQRYECQCHDETET